MTPFFAMEKTFILGLLPNDKEKAAVADRIAYRLQRVYEKSDRIQKDPKQLEILASGWVGKINQCLSYSDYGYLIVRKAIVNLVCHYFSRGRVQSRSGLGVRADLVEEFLHDFAIDALRVFRRESLVNENYQPRTPLEQAEFFAFWEQYGRRSVRFSRSSQSIARLRAQSFLKHRDNEWREIPVSFDVIDCPSDTDTDNSLFKSGIAHRVLEEIIDKSQDVELLDGATVLAALVDWFKERSQPDCIEYLNLRMQDADVDVVEAQMGLSKKERDYLQQKFSYHVGKFCLSDRYWRLAHDWLNIAPEDHLGLDLSQWEELRRSVLQSQRFDSSKVQTVLGHLMDGNDAKLAAIVGCSVYQAYQIRAHILQVAKEIREKVE
jgi:hypothetical protein